MQAAIRSILATWRHIFVRNPSEHASISQSSIVVYNLEVQLLIETPSGEIMFQTVCSRAREMSQEASEEIEEA